MMRHTVGALIAALGLLAATAAPMAAAAPMKVKVGIAASPNGYVMKDIASAVAVNANAKIYRKLAGKWMLVGNATPSQAVPITFQETGIHDVKVVSRGESQVVKVAVYGYWYPYRGDAISFGGLVLPSRFPVYGSGTDYTTKTYSIPSSANCVTVDVGIRDIKPSTSYPYEGNVTVNSTSAAPWTSGPQYAADGFSAQGVAVAGDVVLEFRSKGNYQYAGIRALCVSTWS
jgi:hypothetical protein